jgi:hypothetical protein
VAAERGNQQSTALQGELAKLCAQNNKVSSPEEQQGYSLQDTYEKARAASLERGRLSAFCDALCRDTKEISVLAARVSQ